jgi:hypothetical protein
MNVMANGSSSQSSSDSESTTGSAPTPSTPAPQPAAAPTTGQTGVPVGNVSAPSQPANPTTGDVPPGEDPAGRIMAGQSLQVLVPWHNDVSRMTEAQRYAYTNSHEMRHAPQPGEMPMPGQTATGHHADTRPAANAFTARPAHFDTTAPADYEPVGPQDNAGNYQPLR